MNIPEFIHKHELLFARRRVAANPRLRQLGFLEAKYHFRVGIRCQDRRSVFFISADTLTPTDVEILRGLTLEARESRIPAGEFQYAVGRTDERGMTCVERLIKRAAGLRDLLGHDAYEALVTTTIL